MYSTHSPHPPSWPGHSFAVQLNLTIVYRCTLALGDRAETLLTLQTLLADADAKAARISKLETDITKMKKVGRCSLTLVPCLWTSYLQ